MFDTGEMIIWMLALFRATGLFLLLPFFAPRSVPRIMRLAFAAMLAWIVMPLVDVVAVYPADVIELVLLVAKEVAIGVLMGLAVRLVFFAVDMAAQILSVEIGLNPSPEFDSTANVAGNPVGTGLFYLGLVLFFAGAHYAVLIAFVRSFELVPPGLQVPDDAFVSTIVRHTGRIFQLGALMAAPVIAVNFLVNLMFSILGRVVPRMNVFVLSFSVRLGAGLGMLALSLGLISHYILEELGAAPELMLHFLPFGVN